MGKALSYIGGALLALLSALLLVPYMIDWNNYRGAFEEEASRALGREVRVGGQINLRLLPTPYVRIDQIRISDNAGTLGEPFFRVDSFTMGLAIAPLLRGALEATHMELRKPVLTLAVDGDGRGSWRDVQLSPSALAVLPAEVRLHAVEVVDGTLAVKGGGGELLRLTAISGELSADSLKGPFKYRGQATWAGEPREVRLSTAEMEASGELRFKSLVRVPRSAASTSVDGKLADIGGQPRVEGDLAVRMPLTGAGGRADARGDRQPQGDALDLRAKLAGNALGLALSDIAIAFDQGGQPQIIVGEGGAEWQDGLRLKLALTSRWLDLDSIAGGSGDAQPVDAVRTLVPALVRLLPETGQVDARLSVEQVNLGGEVASDLRARLERFRGPMLVRELHAVLPGATRLDISGELAVAAAPSFAGDVSVRGTSLARFLGWAAKGQTVVDSRADGAFAVHGRLGLDGAGMQLAGLTAVMQDAPPVTGSVAYRWADRRRLDVKLAGRELDVSPVLPGLFEPARAKALLWPDKAQAGAAPTTGLPAWLDSRTGDAAFALRIGRLSDGLRVLSDVDATLAIEEGRLRVSRVQLTTPDGLRLDAEGEIADLAGTPSGTLSGDVTAATAAALSGALRGLALADGDDTPARTARLERVVPARLAGSLRVGATTEIALDGLVRDSRASGRLQFAPTPAGWRDAPLELTARVDNPDAAMALAELLGGQPMPATGPALGSVGAMRLKAIGRPRTGMVVTATLTGDRLAMAFDGTVRAGEPGRSEYDGTLRLEMARAEPALAMLGLAGVAPLSSAALAGSVEISARADALQLRPSGLTLAGEPIHGQISLARGTFKPARIDASLEIARASVPGLLSALVESRTPRQPAGPAPALASEGPWSERPFDLAVLDTVQGRARLAIGRLALEPGLELADAVLDMELAPGQLKITNLDGQALGGAAQLRMTLERERSAAAGIAMAGALRVDNARLEALAGPAAASGSAGMIVQFSGRALSPQGLISAMQGRGEITLGRGQLSRLSPSALPRTVAAVLDGRTELAPDTIRKLLLEALAAPAAIRLAADKIPIQIANGAARLGKVGFETEDGRGSITTTIDLASLKFDSDWRLEAKPAPRPPAGAATAPTATPERGTPPEVSVVYVGPLRSIATLEPRIQSDAFERALTVWRMERDVGELERLRREDEERIKREQERQRAAELERVRAQEHESQRLRELVPPSILKHLPLPAARPLSPPPLPAPPGAVLPPPPAGGPASLAATPPPAVAAPQDASPPALLQPGQTGTVVTTGGNLGEGAAQAQTEPRPAPVVRQGPRRPPRPADFNPFPAVPN